MGFRYREPVLVQSTDVQAAPCTRRFRPPDTNNPPHCNRVCRNMRISLSPQEFHELLLSHHPDLPAFRDDVIVIAGRRICAGCLLGYPAALVTLALLHPSGWGSIAAAILISLLSQGRKLVQNAAVRHLGRVIAGIGLGCGLGGAYWAVTAGAWPALLVLAAGAAAYLAVRVVTIRHALEQAYGEKTKDGSE